MIVTTRSGLKTPAATTTARASAAAHARLATIDGTAVRVSQEMHFVLIVRRNLDAKIIMSAAAHRSIRTDHFPVSATVIRAPQFSDLGLFSLIGRAVADFNQRVDALR